MQIEIPEKLFARLQKHATPLVDTSVSVIERLTDFYEQHNHKAPYFNSTKLGPIKGPSNQSGRELNVQNPPSLLHTRVQGEFAMIPFSNWNDLLRIAHVETFKKEKSFERVRSATLAQISPGDKSDDGYKYIAEIGFSLQGVDAVRAWKYALRLAMYLQVPIEARIEWRDKDEAAFPGERGVLKWNP